jgi:hypothetical protein
LENLSTLNWSDSTKLTSITLEPRTISSSLTNNNLLKLNDTLIIQIKYHFAYPQLLFVIFSNEICLVETQHCQVIYSAIIDSGSPLVQVIYFF